MVSFRQCAEGHLEGKGTRCVGGKLVILVKYTENLSYNSFEIWVEAKNFEDDHLMDMRYFEISNRLI